MSSTRAASSSRARDACPGRAASASRASAASAHACARSRSDTLATARRGDQHAGEFLYGIEEHHQLLGGQSHATVSDVGDSAEGRHRESFKVVSAILGVHRGAARRLRILTRPQARNLAECRSRAPRGLIERSAQDDLALAAQPEPAGARSTRAWNGRRNCCGWLAPRAAPGAPRQPAEFAFPRRSWQVAGDRDARCATVSHRRIGTGSPTSSS